MRLANHYLRTALDQVQEGVIMLDGATYSPSQGPRVLYNNSSITELVGASPGKGLRGKSLMELAASESDATTLLSALQQATSHGQAECQASLRVAKGETRHCHWQIKTLRSSSRQLLNYTLTVRPALSDFALDTNHVGNQAKQDDLDTQTERLRIENLAALAQGIAHDVNNLLGPITAQLSFIMPQIEANSELGQALDVVLAAVKRAKQFTTQVVKTAKARHSVMQSIDLGDIIRDTVRLAQAGSNVDVRISLADTLKPALADPIKITQVLQNLVLNGIQAMPSGGFMDVEAHNLDLHAGESPHLAPGPYLEVIVRDRGCGIAPENLQRLFKESFTTKADGNGIGLTTCKRFIDEHRGEIRVNSTPRVGTEFRVLLPAATQPAPKSIAPPNAAQASLQQGQGHVLIVDDDPQIRAIASFILKRCGYTLYQSNSGEAALRLYQQQFRSEQPLDAVIMDLTLKGGMEGLETSQAIWRLDPAARIIVSSGSVTEDVQRTFLDQGFFALLPKPYEAAELAQAVYLATQQKHVPIGS